MGRCAGCSRTGSLRTITIHIVECPQYQALYAHDPASAVDPGAEFLRHRAETRDPQARAQQRDARMTVRFAEINRQQLASAQRWATPPDLLD